MLPDVSCSVNGQAVAVQGWAFNDSEGGFDQCSGVLTAADYARIGEPTQGATVTMSDDTPEARWAGRWAAPPQLIDGRAIFNAVGHREQADKRTRRLFIMSNDTSIWVPYDAEPHLDGSDVPVYEHMRRIGLDSSRGGIRFSLTKDQAMTNADAAAFIWYAEGVEIRQLKFRMTYDAADEFAKMEIRTRRANGPTGSATVVDTYGLTGGNRNTVKTSSHAVSGRTSG